ncbi:succinyldiaminopimelate aminotransferase apoenzyme [Austwickia chelonae]|uniref:Putative aminotransferase n=1 Tax=Austwickia chelonae NBRC 105200 TaxID=1184607 RepID=K6V3C7_9MICO|nr:aminotransferase class I/II-fold pyridoxal phosphate-dependent enzyme [Austwickia chelonae]GAB76553.1 putative aminotransferase [Austwickia chelonae NBRC 105200]SEW26708.1 succinyldiaminopimelate aminotransferase apoenzyme [Austwickia chelonae]
MTAPLTSRMREFGTTIFTVMSDLAARHGAVNLGQGFPDTDGPEHLMRAAAQAIQDGHNQYPPLRGNAVLREAVAEHQHRFYDLSVDPHNEILITAGATEGLSVCLNALCEPGDEVVLIEPFYDAYAAAVALAGGRRRTVPLRGPDLRLQESDLRAAVGPRTRAIVVNTPHNPTGKVFDTEELTLIGKIAVEAGCWVITDEVYEHLVYDDVRHVPLAVLARTVPELAPLDDRLLTISSAGKTFSVTGWKIGWITGRAAGIAATATVKQYLSFSGGAPFQPAVAAGLRQEDRLFDELTTSMRVRRDILADGLREAGFTVRGGQGTYFLLADASPLGVTDASAFCQELPARCGVVGIPVTAFCDEPDPYSTLVRFAYCKREDVLVEAARRLRTLHH